jgi:hypothetical protein
LQLAGTPAEPNTLSSFHSPGGNLHSLGTELQEQSALAFSWQFEKFNMHAKWFAAEQSCVTTQDEKVPVGHTLLQTVHTRSLNILPKSSKPS